MKCDVVKGSFSVGVCHKPLDFNQPEAHDHCWLMDCYTNGCSSEHIPSDAHCVAVDDVITVTYDGIAKQLTIVVNDVCCACV